MNTLTQDQVLELCTARKLEHPRKRHAWLVAAAATIEAAKGAALEDAAERANNHPDVVAARINSDAANQGYEATTKRLAAKAEYATTEKPDPDSPEGSDGALALAAIIAAPEQAQDQADLEAGQRLANGFGGFLGFLAHHHLVELVSVADLGARRELARAHEQALGDDWTPETAPFETAAHA